VPVRLGLEDEIAADIAARAGAVLDQRPLREAAAQLVAEHARQHVGRAARGERHDDAQRLAAEVGRAGANGEGKDECSERRAAAQESFRHGWGREELARRELKGMLPTPAAPAPRQPCRSRATTI
jgi:hypothetical protein